MRNLFECLAKQNSARPSNFSSVTALYFNSYYLTQIQNRNRIAREDKYQKQNRYTRNIVELKQNRLRRKMMGGRSQERASKEQKQTRNRMDVLEICRNEIDWTDDVVLEGSREGDNRLEIDQKQNGYTRNILEMTRWTTMYGRGQERVTIDWKQTRNRINVLEIQQKRNRN